MRTYHHNGTVDDEETVPIFNLIIIIIASLSLWGAIWWVMSTVVEKLI